MMASLKPAAIALVLLAAVLCTPLAARGQGATTGSIGGSVTDNSGAVVPGVTVTATSPNLQGSQVAVTNDQGQYRFPAVPPGVYKLTYELAGFSTVVREGIQVSLGFKATVNVQLAPASVKETVTVSGQTPVVDTQNTNIQNNFNSEMLKSIPNARDIWSVISEAPGMTVGQFDVGGSRAGSQTSYTSYGASDQNRVQIAGVNTTEGTGSAGYYYDYGAFEEISLATSNAADAQMPTSGLLLNAVLKSGGNQIHGDGYIDYENESLQGHNVDARLKSLGIGTGARMQRYLDPNFNIGGPIMRDGLWYFVSGRYQEIRTSTTGWPVQAPGTGPKYVTRLENVTYKLTYRASDNNKISHFLQLGGKQQPYRGANATLYLDAPQDQEDGAWSGNFEWNRIVSNAVFFDVRGSTFGYNWPNYGYGPDGTTYNNRQFRRVDNYTGNTAGAYGEYRIDRRRYQFDYVLNMFRDNWPGGQHLLKVGWLSEYESGETENGGYVGDMRLIFNSKSGVDFSTPYRVDLYNHPTVALDDMWHHGAFLQDQLQISKAVTLNVGLRWDYYNAFEPEQAVRGGPFTSFFYDGVPLTTSAGPYSLAAAPFAGQRTVPAKSDIVVYKKAIAPRTGISWNVTGDGRTVVKASWGRFYNNPSVSISQDVNPLQSTTATFNWIDKNKDQLFQMDELGSFVSVSGGVRNSIQPGIGHPYTDEMNAWFEHELRPNLGVRAGVVYKRVMHQWRLIDLGRPYSLWTVPVSVADPGPDGVVGTSDDGPPLAVSDMSTVTAGRTQYQAPDDNNRFYKNIDLTLNKRMSDKWSLVASFLYTWRNQLWTNAAPNPNNEINNRAHTTLWAFKLFGSYRAPHGIVVSPVLRWQAGAPLPRIVSASGLKAGTFSILAEPVGTYRQDNVAIFDTRVEKQFRTGRRTVGLFLDLFNLTNSNAAQDQDTTTGVKTVNVDGVSSKVQRFLYPNTIIGPRIARFGFKLTF